MGFEAMCALFGPGAPHCHAHDVQEQPSGPNSAKNNLTAKLTKFG